jgi:ABC-type multidrug transport system fused ATPase/permease subunit
MQTDKSATILEVQWMELEIPKIEQELNELRAMEQELLTTPLETVHQAYTTTYRNERRRAQFFYRRRRTVAATAQGYRQRMRDEGWFTILARILIAAIVIWAVYVVFSGYREGNIQRGVIWGSVLLVLAVGLAFAPALADLYWERRARQMAESAAQETRQSPAFLQERQDRQAQLEHCRRRIAELESRHTFAHARLDGLRKELTSDGAQPQSVA